MDLWAKKSKKNEKVIHLLQYHLLDTANVVVEMWNNYIHGDRKSTLCKELGLSENDSRDILAFWASLHDIGKATSLFQKHIELQNPSHGASTTYLLRDLFKNGYKYSSKLSSKLSSVIGGHHGSPIISRDLDKCNDSLFGDRTDINKIIKDLVEITGVGSIKFGNKELSNTVLIMIAGIISYSDWIASDDYCFKYKSDIVKLSKYNKESKEQAKKAFSILGWTKWTIPTESKTIGELFPLFTNLRPLQNKTEEISEKIKDASGLVIIEAPMGEGKTEAALKLIDTYQVSLQQEGFYFALPTQATSNQMFKRIKEFLEIRYKDDIINYVLQHGRALLTSDFNDINDSVHYAKSLASGSGVIASRWFTRKQLGFLAPFGVGTIDQTLLSILDIKHFFIRLFGLSNKTIVIDEVHAYDAYMTTLLERLLGWPSALNTSVIILSATLPQKKRDSLMKAYCDGRKLSGNIQYKKYPRISYINKDCCGNDTFSVSNLNTKKVNIEWVNGDLPVGKSNFILGKKFEDALTNGGCAAIICNTVKRAQDVYLRLKGYFKESEIDILHSRYMFKDRQAREKMITDKVGKDDKNRPYRSILVATQVIEQSLDFDFDIMYTDFAPIDLMIQRVGRVHRHIRSSRPIKNLTLWIEDVKEDNGIPKFDFVVAKYIYDKHILLRSWLALDNGKKNYMNFPNDIELLVEKVYGGSFNLGSLSRELQELYNETLKKSELVIKDNQRLANEVCIPFPNFVGNMFELRKNVTEAKATRLFNLSVSVICLFEKDGDLFYDIDRNQQLNSNDLNKIDIDVASKNIATITNRSAVGELLEDDENLKFSKISKLKNYRLLVFDKDNRVQCGKVVIKYDKELGIIW